MARLRYVFEKLQLIYGNSAQIRAEWYAVDTDNKFIINNQVYVIDKTVEQYVVKNVPVYNADNSSWNQWTNESEMDRVLCVYESDSITFYDQNVEKIDNSLVKKLSTKE